MIQKLLIEDKIKLFEIKISRIFSNNIVTNRSYNLLGSFIRKYYSLSSKLSLILRLFCKLFKQKNL